MKKIIYSMLMLAAVTFAMTSCEDVPAPYDTPTSADSDSSSESTATGDGSLENPFNSVAANNLGETLSSGSTTDDYYYIQGIVVSVSEEYSSSYGNATFYISPDGSSTDKFYCYRVYYLNNQKWTDSDPQIEAGDSVIVYAKITNYSGTIETAQSYGYLYYHNGSTGSAASESTGEATGSGTKDDPYNVAAAIAYTSALSADVTSSEKIYIKGIVASIKASFSSSYGNASFYISDDGSTTTTFLVYRAYYLNNQKWTESDPQIAVGDEVVIYGNVVNYYGNTPETSSGNAYVYSHTSGSSSDSDDSSGDVETTDSYTSFTAEGLGLDNAAELTTIDLGDGTTLTFSQGSGSTTPKYYSNGTNLRVYPGNTISVSSSKTISSIVITCDVVSGVTCNASGDVGVSTGSISFDDAAINITGVNSTSTVITNNSSTTGTASQVRILSMTIYYAN